MSKKLSFPKEKIKIALLEKIHPAAMETLEQAGYHAERIPRAVEESELIDLISDAHILGVRSRTKIKAEHIAHAKRLLAIGCFTVGTDQVDLGAARDAGIPVFNAPHSSTRSVAELALGNIVCLARRTVELSALMHAGRWKKSAKGATEVRNKTLGIIGYGHIGQQVGILAEAFGMNVLFYDIAKKLPLGRAQAVDSQEVLLSSSDFVSLHVPGGEENEKMIGESEIAQMRDGAYLINLARGQTVDLDAARAALESGKLSGGAFDVYPVEPAKNESEFENPLKGLSNVIITPHIGGSTEEAQSNIGREVAESLIGFIDQGTTDGSVNFPQVKLPKKDGTYRILYIHKNEPGALSTVNSIISELGVNICAQYLGTQGDIGYLLMDTDKEFSNELKEKIEVLPRAIKTRILY